ncbi:MAG TPA: hypothetical protein DDY88_03965 [Actinobacteria bacterium]|nr:hypothetical protein [Actinomycetota bacterium]
MSRRWGARSIASLLLFVLASVLTPFAVVGHWGHSTVSDAEQYIATVGPLASDPAIQQAVGEEVTAALVARIDTETLVSQFLDSFVKNPQINERLASPIAAGVNSLIGTAVQKFLESSAFETVWIKTNEAAQRSAMALLEGKEAGIIQTNGDEVVLDLSTLLTAVQRELVDSGLSIAANVQIPQTGHQIVLFETPLLGQLQTIYGFTSPILEWLPLLVAALFALSIALARKRPRLVLTLGVVLAVEALLLMFAMNVSEAAVQLQLGRSGMGLALSAFWSTFFAYLLNGLQALLMLGVFASVAGWYAGSSRWALHIREEVCKGLHELGAPIPEGLNTFVRSYSLFLKWGVSIVVGLLLFTVGNMDLARTFWLGALGVLLFAGIEACNRPDRDVYVEIEPPTAELGISEFS